MRLTGPRIWGPPADPEQAVAVLRRAVELGVRVIDTAWYYGQDVANELIARALQPYLDDVLIVTKLGATRTENGAWRTGVHADQLREGNERDRRVLGLDTIGVTHLRWAEAGADDIDGVRFADALETMLELKAEGKIAEIGLSNVSVEQLDYALGRTTIATVSNLYSLNDRSGQVVLDRCTAEGIAVLPTRCRQGGVQCGGRGDRVRTGGHPYPGGARVAARQVADHATDPGHEQRRASGGKRRGGRSAAARRCDRETGRCDLTLAYRTGSRSPLGEKLDAASANRSLRAGWS
jgi:aryl-alcohol dehydrogenase-like predicted oxidoreductase